MTDAYHDFLATKRPPRSASVAEPTCSPLTEAEENADSYGSWLAAIAEMRRRRLAGEPRGKIYLEAERRQRNGGQDAGDNG